MRYRIIKDSRWPDYYLEPDPNGVEVSPELYRHWKRVTKQYDAVMDEIEKLDKGQTT